MTVSVSRSASSPRSSPEHPTGQLSVLDRMLENLASPDETASAAVADRASQVLRPTGAFERLDQIAAWLAGWQRTREPAVKRPTALVFAADHGVAAEGVSAYPAEVTAAMSSAVDRGAATVNAVADQVGATVRCVDVGVGMPTGNIRTHDAMSADEFDAAINAGAEAVERSVRDDRSDLLVMGELGIGNTTAAAAVCGLLFVDDAASHAENAARWTGSGTGVRAEALDHKRAVVRDVLKRVGSVTPLEALRRAGGCELAAIAGAVAAARQHSVPVILDGFIGTAAAAPLALAAPDSLNHCIAGHCSAELGHQELLSRLGLEPLVRLDLRLGEGTGALTALPIVRIAAAAVTNVATFEEWGLG